LLTLRRGLEEEKKGQEMGRREAGGRRVREGQSGGRQGGRQGGGMKARREAGRQGGREAGRQGGREAGRQGGREAGRQGDREAGRGKEQVTHRVVCRNEKRVTPERSLRKKTRDPLRIPFPTRSLKLKFFHFRVS
jgi:hypothetical protein